MSALGAGAGGALGRGLTVADAMTPSPRTAHADARVAEAARALDALGVRHLPVVDDAGRLIGVVDDLAVRAVGLWIGGTDGAWVPWDLEREDLRVREIAQAPRAIAHPEQPWVEALGGWMAARVDATIVIDSERRPIGILTEQDALRWAVARLPPELPCGDIASDGLVAVTSATPATALAEEMSRRGLRHAVLTLDGALAGVISHRDLVYADQPGETELTAAELVASTSTECAHPQGSAREAGARMLALKIGCLPLVDEIGRPFAVITRSDLVRAALAL
jgi:CBS domain-containing protein